MRAIVNKIDPLKESRNGNKYNRIYFTAEDGTFYWTDVCPTFRNYPRWAPIIESGVGTRVDGLELNTKRTAKGFIDADSLVWIVAPPPAEEEKIDRSCLRCKNNTSHRSMIQGSCAVISRYAFGAEELEFMREAWRVNNREGTCYYWKR